MKDLINLIQNMNELINKNIDIKNTSEIQKLKQELEKINNNIFVAKRDGNENEIKAYEKEIKQLVTNLKNIKINFNIRYSGYVNDFMLEVSNLKVNIERMFGRKDNNENKENKENKESFIY